jgi:hypothetical protein
MLLILTYYGMMLEREMSNLMNGFCKQVSIAFLVMPLLAPITGHASTLIGTFNTGVRHDPGGCFNLLFNRFIGAGYRAANVQLSGFDMSYLSGDHNIRRSSMRVADVFYNSGTGRVSFSVRGCFHDRNGDDDFIWDADIAIVADRF